MLVDCKWRIIPFPGSFLINASKNVSIDLLALRVLLEIFQTTNPSLKVTKDWSFLELDGDNIDTSTNRLSRFGFHNCFSDYKAKAMETILLLYLLKNCFLIWVKEITH